MGTLYGSTSLYSEFRCATVNFHIAQEGVTTRVFIPGLVGSNASTRNGNTRTRVSRKRDVAAAESEGMVGGTGIDAVKIVLGNHAVEGGVEVGGIKINAVCTTHHGAAVAGWGRVVKIKTNISIIAYRARG